MAHFESLPVGELRLEERIYPRARLDRVLVDRYINALKAGAKLDQAVLPIRVWRRDGSYWILDGAHRCAAYVQVFGPAHHVRVLVHEEDEFADETEAALEALRLNSAHGKNVCTYDIALVYTRLREHGVTVEEVAQRVYIPPETLQARLEKRLAMGPLQPIGGGGAQENLVALKRPSIHLAGEVINAAQAQYQVQAVGLAQLRLIKELIRLIDTGTLDLGNSEVRAALRALYSRLTAILMGGAA